jgi:hypothetical protein
MSRSASSHWDVSSVEIYSLSFFRGIADFYPHRIDCLLRFDRGDTSSVR